MFVDSNNFKLYNLVSHISCWLPNFVKILVEMSSCWNLIGCKASFQLMVGHTHSLAHTFWKVSRQWIVLNSF
jgi:hypothetical protein